MLEAAPDAIVIVGETGLIELVNSQTEKLFGYSRDQILGQPVEILIPHSFRAAHPSRRQSYFHEPRVRGMGEGLTLYGLRRDGSEFPVEISLSPLQTSEGRLVTAAIRDVTERRRVERALAEKNAELAVKNIELERANKTKDRFLATISHELRTPLNAIIGFTGTLLMRLPGPLTSEQEQQLTTVQSSGRHLLALINDLLDLAKIESGKLELHAENVHTQQIVDEVVAALGLTAKTKGLELTVDYPSEPLWVRTDRRALSQILLNLASNAIKFTPRGSVCLQVRGKADGSPYRVTLNVVDSGIGIREDDLERLFQAFEQLDNGGQRQLEGSGLGLHLSHKLSAVLGGDLSVASAIGAGSTFSLRLPDLP